MDTEIADRLDRSIGDGPEPHPSLEALLVEGHRAVRRRHLTLGSASAAAVAAIAVTASMLAGASSDHAGTDVVQQPTGSPSATPATRVDPAPSDTPPTPAEVRRVLRHLLVSVVDGGQVAVSEGTVLRRVDNPFGVAAPATSLALEIQVGGGVYWYARYDGPGQQGGEAMAYSGNEKGPLETWLEQVSGLATGEPSVPDASDDLPGIAGLDLVSFVGDTEQLRPSESVTILEQRPHVGVGDSFAGPRDRTAAARVRTDAGETYYVLARGMVGEDPQYIAVPVGQDGVGTDLDAFLDFARERYAEGGGGLL